MDRANENEREKKNCTGETQEYVSTCTVTTSYVCCFSVSDQINIEFFVLLLFAIFLLSFFLRAFLVTNNVRRRR